MPGRLKLTVQRHFRCKQTPYSASFEALATGLVLVKTINMASPTGLCAVLFAQRDLAELSNTEGTYFSLPQLFLMESIDICILNRMAVN